MDIATQCLFWRISDQKQQMESCFQADCKIRHELQILFRFERLDCYKHHYVLLLILSTEHIFISFVFLQLNSSYCDTSTSSMSDSVNWNGKKRNITRFRAWLGGKKRASDISHWSQFWDFIVSPFYSWEMTISTLWLSSWSLNYFMKLLTCPM